LNKHHASLGCKTASDAPNFGWVLNQQSRIVVTLGNNMKQLKLRAPLVAVALLASAGTSGAPGQTLTYSAWTKFCPPGKDAICFSGTYTKTAPDGSSGSVLLIQPQAPAPMTLRVAMPLGAQLSRGLHFELDGTIGRTGNFLGCDPAANGCFTDFAVDDQLLSQLKASIQLAAQSMPMNRQTITLQFPLVGFGPILDSRSQSQAGPGPLQRAAKFWLERHRAEFSDRDLRALIYSPWVKLCGRNSSKQTCVTVKDGRQKNGQLLISVAAIEQDSRTMLRIRLPYGTDVSQSVRIAVDQTQVGSAPFTTCLPVSIVPTGCIADIELTAEFLSQLADGDKLLLSAVQKDGSSLELTLSLSDFLKTFRGPSRRQEEGAGVTRRS
jgi:invasion protein IalB